MGKHTKRTFRKKTHTIREMVVFQTYTPYKLNTTTRKKDHQINIEHHYNKKRFVYTNLKHTNKSTEHIDYELCEYTQSPISQKAIFKLFYFVHITKTAGTALKKCLQEQCAMPTMSTFAPQNMLLQGKPIFRNNKKQKHPSYTRFLSKGHLTVNNIDPRIPTICILREPLSRVRSAFRYLSEGGKHGEVWDYPERAMMELFQKHNISYLSDIFELKDSVLKKRILEHPHFRPQSEFICAPNTLDVIVDHVFVLESFDAKEVAKLLNIYPFKMEQRNKSEIKYDLTKKDKEHIREYYKDDFEIYARYVKSK